MLNNSFVGLYEWQLYKFVWSRDAEKQDKKPPIMIISLVLLSNILIFDEKGRHFVCYAKCNTMLVH